MMICLAIPSEAQTSSKVLQNYYIYASIEVRWANKATGEPCFVILISPGENGQQRPSILKNSEGKYVIVRNMMEGLAYLEVQGWELQRLVKANTTYEEVAPKVQLNLSEQTLKVDYK